MLLFTVGSSVREGDPRMMMMATFFLSPPVKIRLFLHVHPIVKRLTKTISINRDCDIKNPPNSSTKWTRNNNKWRAIYLLLSNAIPANVFIWKVSRLNRFLRNILCPLGRGGGNKNQRNLAMASSFCVYVFPLTWKKEVADVISRRLLSLAINNWSSETRFSFRFSFWCEHKYK